MSIGLGITVIVGLIAAAVLLQIRASKRRPQGDRRVNGTRRERVQILLDLPQKAQLELMRFYEERAQTLARDPSDPSVVLLVEKGILHHEGDPAGGLRRTTVTPEFWDVMKFWLSAETRKTIRGSHQERE